MKPTPLAALLLTVFAAACSRGPADGTLHASGTIEARQVRLSAKTPGDLLEVAVREGDRVRPGDKIASIDHSLLDIQLRQAEAGAALAKAQLDLIKAGARVEDIRQAEEGVRQAEAARKTADDDARRMRDLAAKGSVTAKQAEDAEARLTVARAQSAATAEALKKVRALARPEEIRAAEARLDQAAAAADLLRKSIADCVLVSPVPGIITQVPVERGEMIAAGATVAVVTDLDRVHLTIYVGEAELARVAPRYCGRGDDRRRVGTDAVRHRHLHLARSRVHAQERPDPPGSGQAGLRRQDRDRQPGRVAQARLAGRRRIARYGEPVERGGRYGRLGGRNTGLVKGLSTDARRPCGRPADRGGRDVRPGRSRRGGQDDPDPPAVRHPAAELGPGRRFGPGCGRAQAARP